MDERQLSGPEHRLERPIFSDAVFAIAITLPVIDLHAPHLRFGASGWDHGVTLNTLPSFGGFLISFFGIGAFWAAHHRTFALARRWSDRLVGPNLQLLAAIAAMPFFTAFMSGNPTGRVPAMQRGLAVVLGRDAVPRARGVPALSHHRYVRADDHRLVTKDAPHG